MYLYVKWNTSLTLFSVRAHCGLASSLVRNLPLAQREAWLTCPPSIVSCVQSQGTMFTHPCVRKNLPDWSVRLLCTESSFSLWSYSLRSLPEFLRPGIFSPHWSAHILLRIFGAVLVAHSLEFSSFVLSVRVMCLFAYLGLSLCQPSKEFGSVPSFLIFLKSL